MRHESTEGHSTLIGGIMTQRRMAKSESKGAKNGESRVGKRILIFRLTDSKLEKDSFTLYSMPNVAMSLAAAWGYFAAG